MHATVLGRKLKVSRESTPDLIPYHVATLHIIAGMLMATTAGVRTTALSAPALMTVS